MDEHELEQRLRSLRVPSPSTEHVEQTLHRARAALSEPGAGVDAGFGARKWLGWIGVCAAAAALFLVVAPWPGPPKRLTEPRTASAPWVLDLGGSRRLLQEMRELFPTHLQAVVVDRDGLHVMLHTEPVPASDQAILFEVAAPGSSPVQVISFSGQSIRARLAGKPVDFELLLTGDDGVLVTGDAFVWTEEGSAGVGDWTIRAEPLETSM